eukprot:scaffold18145_cov35-Tisochrysis_lutea.AAC.11
MSHVVLCLLFEAGSPCRAKAIVGLRLLHSGTQVHAPTFHHESLRASEQRKNEVRQGQPAVDQVRA